MSLGINEFANIHTVGYACFDEFTLWLNLSPGLNPSNKCTPHLWCYDWLKSNKVLISKILVWLIYQQNKNLFKKYKIKNFEFFKLQNRPK